MSRLDKIAEKTADAIDNYSTMQGGMDSVDEAIPIIRKALEEALTHKPNAYLSVYPVGYVSIAEVEKVHGKEKAESLREHLDSDDKMDRCSMDHFESEIEKSRDCIKPEIIEFFKTFLDECREAGADEVIFYS